VAVWQGIHHGNSGCDQLIYGAVVLHTALPQPQA